MTKRYTWTLERIAVLRRTYPNTPTAEVARKLGTTVEKIYARVWKLGIKKTDEYLASPAACRLRRGDNVGAAFRFKPGHKTWNAGMKGWQAGGRAKETQFKKGSRSVRWDPEIYCVGALRLNADGGLDIKVLPHGNRPGRYAWEPLARYVWRTERGPIPKGMAVRAINGDADDTRIENLRLATRAELMRQNTIHNYPKPIARAVQLRGALNRRINRLEREQRGENA